MTSDLSSTITGNDNFGFVLPSHSSTSCVDDSYADLTVHIQSSSGHDIEEMATTTTDGVFSTPIEP